jgi:hypothetical protein
VDLEYRLTEEVARWAFEVQVDQRTDWIIAFVNPTAGPWKRLMGRDAGDVPGEVHRFEREERRPDLVIVSDKRELLLIIEAKDSIDQLARPMQVEKSSSVVAELTSLLRTQSDNPFWGRRAEYTTMAGLLWAVEHSSTSTARTTLFAAYEEALPPTEGLASQVLGIECFRGDEGVKCRGFLSSSESLPNGVTAEELLSDLGLKGE